MGTRKINIRSLGVQDQMEHNKSKQIKIFKTRKK